MAGKGIKHPHLRHWGQEWVCRGFLHGMWTGHLPPSCFSTVAMPLLINTALVCGCSDGWSNLSNGSIPAAKSNPNKQVLVSYLTPPTSAELSHIQTFTMWLFLIKKLQMKCLQLLSHSWQWSQWKASSIKLTLNHSMNSVVTVNRVYKSSEYQLLCPHMPKSYGDNCPWPLAFPWRGQQFCWVVHRCWGVCCHPGKPWWVLGTGNTLW